MRNIMLDIETLSTHGDAVILSIGAVEFDGGELGRSFNTRIDIDSCLGHGLKVDGKTIVWWMGKPDEARILFDLPTVSLERALIDLRESFEWKDKLVWCNGMNFDLPILENAYRALGLATPWKYYNGRDYRTVKGMFSQDVINSVRVEPVVAHDALDDAKAQALTLMALLSGGEDESAA